jgi:ribosomal protein S18 acetylase RimI-like enzyme
MGGTQASNARDIAFYEKHGFVRCGGFWTDQYNHDMRLTMPPPAGCDATAAT